MSVESNGKTILLIDVLKTFRVLFGPLVIRLYKFLSDSLESFEAELLVCVVLEAELAEELDEFDDEFDDDDESDEEVLVVDDVDEEKSFSSRLLSAAGLGMNAFIMAEFVLDELAAASFVFLASSLSKLLRIVSERIIFFLSPISCLSFLKSSLCIRLILSESTCSIFVERSLSSLLPSCAFLYSISSSLNESLISLVVLLIIFLHLARANRWLLLSRLTLANVLASLVLFALVS